MAWNLSFITEEDFTNHVKATIDKYGEKLESFDIVRFNKNIIDPIKMIFDKTVYQSTWGEIVSNEIFRQRDKANNNDIGYFHQGIFQYIADCHVPDNGKICFVEYMNMQREWKVNSGRKTSSSLPANI